MHNPGRLLIGVTLVVVGALFLLDLADVIDAWEIVGTWWPVVLIAFGLVSIIGPARSVLGGSIVVVIGVVLLLATLDILDASAGNLILPLILIAVGLGLLFVRAGFRSSGDPHNSVNAFAMFGGQEIVSRATAFTGGSLTTLFGGLTLDLRRAGIDPEGARVETFVAFGGIDVVVPRGWRVTVSGMPLFGAFEDKLDRSVETVDDAPSVRIGGIVLFGAVEVKHQPD